MVLEEIIGTDEYIYFYLNVLLYLTIQIHFRHITMPNGSRRDHFLHWIENLSDRQSPSWLGLPNNAEKVLLTTRGMLKTNKLQLLFINSIIYS